MEEIIAEKFNLARIFVAYSYTDSTIAALLRGLSVERLTRYAELAPDMPSKQLELYAWNTALSESLYTPIQGLEVTARNYFHAKLCEQLGEEWYDNPKIQFAYSQARSLAQAKETLVKERKPINPGNLISQLSFGFWTGLLGSKYETVLWRNGLYKAFTYKPSPFLRKEAHHEFDLIRLLRNRIAHHEPILRADLPCHHARMIKMIGWFCQETAQWIEAQSRFDAVWQLTVNPFLC